MARGQREPAPAHSRAHGIILGHLQRTRETRALLHRRMERNAATAGRRVAADLHQEVLQEELRAQFAVLEQHEAVLASKAANMQLEWPAAVVKRPKTSRANRWSCRCAGPRVASRHLKTTQMTP